MQSITAKELNHRLRTGENPPVLLDVREPNEYAYCRIEGSVNLPMNRVSSECSKLDHEKEIVVICHHGIRSAQVANFLDGRGFSKVLNLTGGVAAWANEVDPTMPRY